METVDDSLFFSEQAEYVLIDNKADDRIVFLNLPFKHVDNH